MPFKQLITISIRALLANRFRSFLTMLGVIIGVASVILLVSIGMGFRTFITGELENLGSNLILVVPGEIKIARGGPAAGGGALGSFTTSKLKLSDAEKIKNIPRVANVVGIIFAASPVKFGDKVKSVQIAGTTPEFSLVRQINLEKGEFLTQADVSAARKVVVLGSVVYEELFGEENSLGERVMVGDRRFTVLGVMKKTGGIGQLNLDEQVIIPITTLQQQFNLTNINFINVKVEKADDVEPTIPRIQELLEKRLKREDFTVIDQKEILSTVSNILDTLTLALGGIAAISLLVGGVGVMNIMLVSVTERTREIGLRKAVGATPQIILMQFLLESVILSVTGGVIGITFGVLGSILIGRFITTTVTFWAVAIAFLVSAGVGIIFGVMPARRASKLSPIEALRYE